MERTILRDFLEIPYDKLEEMNLEAKAERTANVHPGEAEEKRKRYLQDEKRIKAVTVAFSDIEGRLHMLDYDKKFLLKSGDYLTFDGSSIRGFTEQEESDLRLAIDWPAFYWMPADIFGPGKVMVFGMVQDRDAKPYPSDTRAMLRNYTDQLRSRDGVTAHAANEIEGFLFKGRDADRNYADSGCFEFASTGGYFHSLPQGTVRRFIDAAAEVQRAMGFGNEKDHPEVAPSQFEMNFTYAEVSIAADQVQLYKLICKQVAQLQDLTASFLPKPVMDVNGNGMHTNLSLSRGGKNVFFEPKGQDGLSKLAWEFVDRILNGATDICLILNSSVNAYRRLDPAYEAPNQIKASAVNRGAMIRVPLANERSARVEVRSVAPDANPYLLMYALLRTGLEGPLPPVEDTESKRPRTRFLPDNIHDAIRLFKASEWAKQMLGEDVHAKYANVKQIQADRCPKALGKLIKRSEVQFHHEVTNQHLWSQF